MRGAEGRSKRGLRTAMAAVVAWVSAASCGGTSTSATSTPSYQDLCTREVALPCAHETVDQCTANAQGVADRARQAGCGSVYDEGVTCTGAHPMRCSGDTLVQDPACATIGRQLLDCMTKAGPAGPSDPCATVPNDPCSQCICAQCPCDSACADGVAKWVACNTACTNAGGSGLSACFQGCNGMGSLSFHAYQTCSMSGVCTDACSGAAGG